MNKWNLNRDEHYFVALKDGTVYQGVYRGWHEGTRCLWFASPVFAAATCGPAWVFEEAISAVFSLGHPARNAEFEAALERILS